jgi:hypothetical protein
MNMMNNQLTNLDHMSPRTTLLAVGMGFGLEACNPETTCSVTPEGQADLHTVSTMEEITDECSHFGNDANLICVGPEEDGDASVLEADCSAANTPTGHEAIEPRLEAHQSCWVTPLDSDEFLKCKGSTETNLLMGETA